MGGQKITSAATSINTLPRLFKLVDWESHRGNINVDIGGGRFETVTDYLHNQGVHNFVYDPFNRSDEHNDKIRRMFMEVGYADSVTIVNVLNVIRHAGARHEVLEEAAEAMRHDGVCFLTVYEGDKSGRGKKTSKGWQCHRRTETYVREVEKVFRDVDHKGRLIVARDPR